MDTQQLQAFIAVAECRSFSEAADRIHLTQPAVSKRVAALETQLGTRLFDRISRTVDLTEAGEALLPRARRILQEIADTQQSINDLSGDVSGRLRLAISHHIGLHRLPPVLKSFSSQFSQVSIDVDFMDSEKAYDGILHGDFEIAVITLAPEPHPKIEANTIWRDPMAFMAAQDHPLAHAPEGTLTLADLTVYPAILPAISTYTGRMIKALFDREEIAYPASIDTNYLETIRMMVSIGLGWSVLPKSMLETGVCEIPLNGIGLERQLGYIRHREKTPSNAGRAFLELLRQQLVS